MSFDEILDVYNYHKKPKVVEDPVELKLKVQESVKITLVKKVEEIQEEVEKQPHFKKFDDLKSDFKRLNKAYKKNKHEIFDIYKHI